MAHKVSFSVPERPLANVDVEFNVRKNETMLGTLKIQGTLNGDFSTPTMLKSLYDRLFVKEETLTLIIKTYSLTYQSE